MGLFHLVEQHDLIGTPPHRFGQHTALVIADIARRGADQPGDRMLLHEFAHVDADHRVLVVEQVLGDGFGQFGLAHAGRPEEQERPERTVFIVQPGTRPAHGIGHGHHRVMLADDPLAQLLFHPQQLLALTFQHLGRGDAGPAFHHFGNLFGPHSLGHKGLTLARLGLAQRLFQRGDAAVLQLSGLGEVALALGLLQLGAGAVELLFQVAGLFQAVAFGLPLCRHLGRLLLQVGQFLVELFQAVLTGRVILFLQGFRFDLHLQDLTVQRVQFFGLGIDLHPQPAGGFVHQVNRLVRQETVGDVAVRQGSRRHKGRVADAHTVVKLILLLDAAQDADRIFDRRLIDKDRLEATGQGRVLFHIFAVFIQRGRADAMQLTPGKRGLDQVGGIHRAVGFAGADKGVHLVDEKDDLAFGRLNLVQHGFQTLLELTAIFRAGDQGAHVQRHQLLVAKALGHVAIDDAQGQAFRNRGLADARLADQHRVVLGAARQNLHRAANLFVAPDDRVDLARGGGFGQVAGIFLQRLHRVLRGRRVGGAALADLIDGRIQALGVHRPGRQRIARPGVDQRQGGQQAFHRNKAVAGLFRHRFGLIQHTDKAGVDIGVALAARNLGQLGDRGVDGLGHTFGGAACLADQVRGKALIVIHQGFQQVIGQHALMIFAHGNRLGRLQESARPFREFLQIHRSLLL